MKASGVGLKIMRLYRSLSPNSKLVPGLLVANLRKYSTFCFQLLHCFTQNARHSCLFKSSLSASRPASFAQILNQWMFTKTYTRGSCSGWLAVWPAGLYGRPAAFTASLLSLIILNAVLIFRNKLIQKIMKNLINIRSSHIGLVGIWG